MGRRKGKIVKTWTHYRYKESATIHLNAENGVFSADYGDTILSSDTLEDLEKQLTTLVEESMKLDWIPVIQISMEGGARFHRDKKIGRGATTEEELDNEDSRTESGNAHLNLSFSRFWIAKEPSGTWLSCHIWHSEDVDGKSDVYRYGERSAFSDPMPRRLNAHNFYISGEDLKKFSLPFKCSDNNFGKKESVHYVKYTPQLWAGLNELAFKVEELTKKLTELLGEERGLLLVEGLINKLLPDETKQKGAL